MVGSISLNIFVNEINDGVFVVGGRGVIFRIVWNTVANSRVSWLS